MRLYLVRHPQPEVAPGVCYGSTDLAVAPQEHERVAVALAQVLPMGLPVFSSPAKRCSELAARLAAMLGARAVTHDPRLAEMHFGAWEMRAWDDIPRAEIDGWSKDLIAYRPGGGESVVQMAQRVHAFHEDIRRQSEHGAAVVVCHAGTIRLLLACQRGLTLAELALHAAQARHQIACGEMIVLDC